MFLEERVYRLCERDEMLEHRLQLQREPSQSLVIEVHGYEPICIAAYPVKIGDIGVAVSTFEEFYKPHKITGAIYKNPPQGVVLLDEEK